MIINKELLDTLTAQAKVSLRLRQNYDLRDSSNDESQRMLNAIEPGTVIPIHRHTMTSEEVIVLRGKAQEVFFDEQGKELFRGKVEGKVHFCAAFLTDNGAPRKPPQVMAAFAHVVHDPLGVKQKP